MDENKNELIPTLSGSKPVDGCFCNGSGLPRTIPLELPGGGWTGTPDYCHCSDGQTAKYEYETGEMKRRVIYAWERAELPLRFRDLRLDTHPLEENYPELFKRFKSETLARTSWFFRGENGTGKTGLAVSMVKYYLDHIPFGSFVPTVLFKTVPDLISDLTSTWNNREANEATILKRLAEIGILILDDLGKEESGDRGWILSRLYQVINSRHGNYMTTIFTSNDKISKIGGTETGKGIAWRIIEMCGEENIIHIEGENLRVISDDI